MERESDIPIHRLVLCGSIVRDDFPWELVMHRLGRDATAEWHAVNDCGMLDLWPVLATSITWGYGASGRFGFQHVKVKDRFFNVGHSGYFDDTFVRRYWLPYLADGKIVEGVLERPTTPWIVSVLTVIRLRYILALLLLAAATLFWTRPALFPYASLEKVAGDGQTIDAAVGGYSLFTVRALARDGSPVVGARVVWHTPYCGERVYVSVTDGTGTTSATNMCNTLQTGPHVQEATLADLNAPIGFRNDADRIPTVGRTVTFSFEFTRVSKQ